MSLSNTRIDRLLANNRFWILTGGIITSIVVGGIIQFNNPPGILRTIRLEEAYGLISLACLYLALLASPLTKTVTGLPFAGPYLHARRAIGVLAFYYALLHVCITFFDQLGGFSGLRYLNTSYRIALISGVIGLIILFFLAATSLDLAVKIMRFKNWKLLHRLIYACGIMVFIHVVVIGAAFDRVSLISIITYVAATILLLLECLRLYQTVARRKQRS